MVQLLDALTTAYDPIETMRLQTVPGGAESPESVRQRSNLAELLAYAQCHEETSVGITVLVLDQVAEPWLLELDFRQQRLEQARALTC
jgi:hypothetical protein